MRCGKTGKIKPLNGQQRWFRHIFREKNTEADELSKWAIEKGNLNWTDPCIKERDFGLSWKTVASFADGAKDPVRSKAGIGYTIYVTDHGRETTT